jgi:hypothetical protein
LRPKFSNRGFALGSSCELMILFYHRNRTVAN